MSPRKRQSRRQAMRLLHVHKPNGVLHPRVQKVGPEHFGIVAVDCAKARSKWMLTDFYGKILSPPKEVAHTRGDLQAAIKEIHEAVTKHDLRDHLAAIERTGDYHLPVQRACRAGGIETRIVHPFSTKRFRQPADPGNKTDDTDLAAIFRAAVNGLGLIEQPLDSLAQRLRLLVRHRRDLVRKRATLQCQIRQVLHAIMPGFAELFADIFENPVALLLARHAGSAEAIRQMGVSGMTAMANDAPFQYRRRTVAKIAAWADNAADADPEQPTQHRIYSTMEEDRIAKTAKITELERDLASLLVQTPYVVLLSVPGINVVSAAEFAGEMGPIEHYANHRAITGRAGLFPSRSQSDRVDLANGPILRAANRRLRFAILTIADNLATSNDHFRALTSVWKAAGKDPRSARVKIASRFCRIAFHMVSGGQVFRHPACQRRDYVLGKLLEFHRQHDMLVTQQMADLKEAGQRLSHQARIEEAKPLADLLGDLRAGRRRGPTLLGDLLPEVLAKLIGEKVELTTAGKQDPG